MKNKFTKIMGIVLTLAILSGLLISAMPVSAGTLTWDNAKMPNNTDFQLVSNGTANVYAFAPDGKTVFSYSSAVAVSGTATSGTLAITGSPVALVAGANNIPVTAAASTGTVTITLPLNVTGTATTNVATVTGSPVALPAGATTTITVTSVLAGDLFTVTLAASGALYKSVDAGITWTNTNLGTGINGIAAGITQFAVSPNYATDTTIWAASGVDIWRSRNGGQTWVNDVTYTGVGAIISLNAAKWYVSGGNIALLAVTANAPLAEIWVFNDNDSWVDYATVGGFVAATTAVGGTFSPNFQSDALIMVATVNAGVTSLQTRVGNAAWNATLKQAILKTKSGAAIPAPAAASFAFPSDFNYNNSTTAKTYVGLRGAAVGATSYDVYRVGLQSQTVPVATFDATILDLSGADNTANANVNDVAYTGTTASGTLVASLAGSSAVYRTANVASSTPTWDVAMAAPYGNSAKLYFVGTTLYAGTLKAFSKSTDYNSFAGISLINVSKLGLNVAVGALNFSNNKILGTDWYVLLTDIGGGPEMIFKSADSGATWGMVYQANGIAGLSNSPAYATDKTIYAYTKNGAPPDIIYKSSDAGATWSMLNPTSKNQSVSAFAAIDGNSYWFGSTVAAGGTGGIYKSGSYTETSLMDGTIPYVIAATPLGIIIPTTTGEIYLSTDSGATFARLGTAAQFGTTPPAFVIDVPGKAIYAANTPAAAASTIYKWVIGTSTSWETVIAVSTTTPAVAGYAVKSMSYSAGVLYIVAVDAVVGWTIPAAPPYPPAVEPPPVPTAAAATNFQILRSVNLTRPAGEQKFDPIAGTQYFTSGWGGFQGAVHPQPITVVNDKFTGNTLYPCVLQAVGVATTPNKTSAHVYVMNDLLTVAPGTAAPTPNAQIPANFNFTWKAITSPQALTYRYQIATDADFNGMFVNAAGTVFNNTTSSTTTYVSGLVPGNSYWYRARVETAAGNNFFSPWSAPVAFKCQLAGDVNQGLNAVDRMTPANGAINTSLTPTFTWGAVAGTDSYTLQVADNPFFANPIEKKPLTTTIWVWDSALKPNTVYYWRVQAVAAGNASTWVANAFTTGTGVAAPAPGATSAPAPTIIVPTPVVNVSVPAPTSQAAAPETPAYIWVIIAIGAVLVIAVIVLIARTRRSA